MTNLYTNVLWGDRTGPAIYLDVAYEKQRSGADMQYRFQTTIRAIGTASFYGYQILQDIALAGTTIQTGYVLKDVTPETWQTAITYTTGWQTVAGVQSGTVPLMLTVRQGSGATTRRSDFSADLPVDPALTTASFGDFITGSANVVHLYARNESYKATVLLRLDSSHTLTNSNIVGSTDTTFNIPSSWASAIPEGVKTGTVEVDTYNGSTRIGSIIVEAQFYVAGTDQPTISVTTAPVDGLGSLYLAGISKVRATITATPSSGATITSMTIGGKEITSPWTSPVLPAGQNLYAAAVYVTDSRGRTASKMFTVTVTPYSPPALTVQQPYRCSNTGAAKSDGTYAYIKGAVSYQQITGNSLTISLAYKLKSASSWTSKGTMTATNLANGYAAFGGSLAAANIYQIRITAQDTVGKKAEAVFTIANGSGVVWSEKDGRICFGGMPDTSFEKGVQIYEQALRFLNGGAIYGEKPQIVSNTVDLNTLKDQGIYAKTTSGSRSSNAPNIGGLDHATNAFWLVCLNLNTGNNYTLQLFFPLYSDGEPALYAREQSNGSWKAWKQMIGRAS